jgi:lipoprotein-releasing system ATP-binding protein
MKKLLKVHNLTIAKHTSDTYKMLLELSHITRYFENGSSDARRNVLDDLSLSVAPGDSIAITGPSGSGKSTLLSIMGTLDRPDSGLVKFRGAEISGLKEPELAGIRNRHIGFVFQLHYLLPQLNLLENILVPVIPVKDSKKYKSAAKRALELLEMVGLKDRIKQRPGQMSVGECQRAAVVRALVNNPELVLADEPTGSLDHKSALQMGDLLKEINQKFSVALVVVTHSTELAQRMNTVYLLDNGKLII